MLAASISVKKTADSAGAPNRSYLASRKEYVIDATGRYNRRNLAEVFPETSASE